MIMLDDLNSLPEDPEILQNIIREIYSNNKELKKQVDKLDQENSWLRELIAARNRRLYGRKSEKLNHEELQSWLFNEAEIGVTSKSPEKDEEETVKVVIRRKSKRGRKPISDKLPRKIVEHDVSESEKKCSCCGKERPKLKPEISEEVEYIPAEVFVNRHIYYKYGPCKCEESKRQEIKPIIRAEREKRIISGCMAAPSLLSFIATSKFCDALPYYRIEEILARNGIQYIRATMCNQMICLSRSLQPLLDLMWEDLLAGDVIRMDETRLQVIDEPERESDQTSWMHVASGEYEGKKIIIFHYHTSRKGEIPKAILVDWQGYLQTDGLAAYNQVGNQ
jgi:transposase